MLGVSATDRPGVAVMLVLLGGSSTFGQVMDVPGAWLGVWKLNPERSIFDKLAPVVVEEQTLKIEATDRTLSVKGDTTLLDGRRVTEEAHVNLNGEPTAGAGGTVAVFQSVESRELRDRRYDEKCKSG